MSYVVMTLLQKLGTAMHLSLCVFYDSGVQTLKSDVGF